MLDINHLFVPENDVQIFNFTRTGSSSIHNQWQTWNKPRGTKLIHMLAVGAGSSGGLGLNTSTTSGGGAGGGSGVQSTLLIPAHLVPDVLYVMVGEGGRQPETLVSAAVNVTGTASLISAEPFSGLAVASLTYLFASPAGIGTAATTTNGGSSNGGASAATLASCNLASLGIFASIGGQGGAAGGGSAAAGGNITFPTTGLKLSGGSGGGGTNGTTARAGGNVAAPTGTLDLSFVTTINGGLAASGATPATRGIDGIIHRYRHSFGGSGGGSATATLGGNAAGGGNGALGCGGGGAGGSNTTNATLARAGNGGDGFVIITSMR